MQHYSQNENYVSLETLDFIVKEHKDLNVSVLITPKNYRLKLYTKRLAFFLGTTRRLVHIPSKSKYPNLWRYLTSLDSETWCRLLYVEMTCSKK